MTSIVENTAWGTFIYTESFWTGKKELYLNQNPLQKINKNTFCLNKDGKNITFFIKGNFITGVKLIADQQEILLSAPTKWYEYVCSILILSFVTIWGNNVALCSIFPIVGGAIGGGISGAMTFVNLISMKAIKKWWLKLLVWLGVFALTVFILFLIAIMFLSVMI